MRKLFLDQDGVLADFSGGVKYLTGKFPEDMDDDEMWKLVLLHPTFYETLLPMPDAMKLWNATKVYNPTILTGVPKQRPQPSEHQKRIWAHKLLGKEVKLIGCAAKDKCKYGKPGDILVDDKTKYQHLWEEMGGIYIHYTDVDIAIKQIQELMNG